jgi:hypothetical protein
VFALIVNMHNTIQLGGNVLTWCVVYLFDLQIVCVRDGTFVSMFVPQTLFHIKLVWREVVSTVKHEANRRFDVLLLYETESSSVR